MFQLIVLVLVVGQCATTSRPAHRRSTESSCDLSPWSGWGECVRTAPCSSLRTSAASYPLPEEVGDNGALAMELLKAEKIEEWENQAETLASINQPKGRVNCVNGYAGRMPCQNVDQLSFVDLVTLGTTPGIKQKQFGNDMWGWTDPQTGDEYVIMCNFGGTSFVRVTDAENPVVLGYLRSRTTTSYWRDVKVVNNHAYIVSEALDHGMQVFDMTHLRNKMSYSLLTPDFEYREVGNAHNIIMNQETQTVFIVGAYQSEYLKNCEGGLHMVDVSTPKKPRFAGCYSADGYTHDAQCIIYRGPDAKYQGREICFSYNENSLTIVDVTDRSNPFMISKYGYAGYAYTHQGWLTEDQSVLLLDDELDEKVSFPSDKRTRTYIWDITSLDTPVFKNTFLSLETSIDHNQYVKGQLTYQSNYAAGLRVLHIDQEQYSLTEVAYFDVLPSPTGVQFRGSWSNYPYFKSGNIAVSSIDYGLFMVRLHDEAMELQGLRSVVTGHQSRNRTVVSATNPDSCPSLIEYQACEPPVC